MTRKSRDEIVCQMALEDLQAAQDPLTAARALFDHWHDQGASPDRTGNIRAALKIMSAPKPVRLNDRAHGYD